MKTFLCLIAIVQLVNSSTVIFDWTGQSFADATAYIIDYLPPVGTPHGGSSLPSSTTRIIINGTIPAAEYSVYVSAVMPDGSRRNVTELTSFSSPDAPILDSIETTEHEATISYFPPQGNDISYLIEYYPEGQQEYANTVETKAALVRLRGLDPGTQFRIKIKSSFHGIRSQGGIEASFKTQGEPTYDYSSSAESYSIRTLPPDFDLATTSTLPNPTTESIYSYEVSVEATTETSVEVTQPTTQTTTMPTTQKITTTVATTIMTTTMADTRQDPEEIDTGDYSNGDLTSLVSAEAMEKDYGVSGDIEMSEEDGMIRLDWSPPDGSICDAFLVNYTILTLSKPKSFSLGTTDSFSLIKMFPEHSLDIRVFCMLAGSLSKTWWAHRIVNLSKPKQIEGFRVKHVETDEFYVAQIELEWDWPILHDSRYYKIIVSYVLGNGAPKEIEVSEPGKVILDKLEPSKLYKISARNSSVELSLKSKPVELEQITPPLISSTLFPGQISSTAININFGDTDPEQAKFDHYVLTFTGNNKNITKRIEMNQERSLTFTKLIPGKTYTFSLFTVYKGVRSRAVVEDITTYPLKVNKLFPVVGADYVVLYWDIENFADSECRFRLSYNADRLPSVSVDLKGASYHKFSGLQFDTYYTFTIIVIMGTGKAASESESEMVTVHTHKERRKAEVAKQGSRELLVEFERDIFSVLNGAVTNYAVIVSDDIELHDDAYELKSWFDVQEEETWGAYRSSPSDFNPFSRSTNKAIFVVGSEDCVRRSLDEPYCNGILRSSVDYVIRVRGYTDTGVAMETEWVAADGEAVDEDEAADSGPSRRLPCHMYLNGCPKSESIISTFAPFIISVLFAIL